MFGTKSKYYDSIMSSLSRIFGDAEMSEAEADNKLQSVTSFDELKNSVADSIKLDFDAKLDALQSQITEASGRVDALQTTINELTAENLTLQNEVTTLRQEAENKDNALKMANERIAGLSGELAAHKAGQSGTHSATDTLVTMPGGTQNKAGGISFSASDFSKLIGVN